MAVLFSWRPAPAFVDITYILASLAAVILLIATLGAFGFRASLNIFPFGEDNNWIDMLRRGSGADAARLLWALDHRNPLSPWWYIAARKIILNFDGGLLALRYGIAGVLAVSTYYMVVMVAGRQARAFALGLAMLVMVWMANRYTEQIIWNFHGALAASVLSVATYAHFLADGRRRHFLYAISIITWFIAFATYTIQCGAVLAIGYLAFRHAPVMQSGVLRSIVERGRIVIRRYRSLSRVVCVVSADLADHHGFRGGGVDLIAFFRRRSVRFTSRGDME